MEANLARHESIRTHVGSREGNHSADRTAGSRPFGGSIPSGSPSRIRSGGLDGAPAKRSVFSTGEGAAAWHTLLRWGRTHTCCGRGRTNSATDGWSLGSSSGARGASPRFCRRGFGAGTRAYVQDADTRLEAGGVHGAKDSTRYSVMARAGAGAAAGSTPLDKPPAARPSFRGDCKRASCPERRCAADGSGAKEGVTPLPSFSAASRLYTPLGTAERKSWWDEPTSRNRRCGRDRSGGIGGLRQLLSSGRACRGSRASRELSRVRQTALSIPHGERPSKLVEELRPQGCAGIKPSVRCGVPNTQRTDPEAPGLDVEEFRGCGSLPDSI